MISGSEEDRDVIATNEKRRIIDKAILAVGMAEREQRISDIIQENEENETTKRCPNSKCSVRYDKNLRKCPACGVFFEKYLRENPIEKPKENEISHWSPDVYYNHVSSMHSPERHETVLLDPVLGNPASRENILALAHHAKESAKIGEKTDDVPAKINDEHERENSRQWAFMSGDAAIALQV